MEKFLGFRVSRSAISSQGAAVGRHEQILATQAQQMGEVLHALQTLTAPAPDPPVPAPNIELSAKSFLSPERYDGSAECCQGFLMQCSFYLNYHPYLRSDNEKVHFMISLLTGVC